MIVWKGKSRIDGAPILLAVSTDSDNPKTGLMVQTWILRSDVSPVEAGKLGLDYSVCGNCQHRHHLGGACYVRLFHGPRAVYAAYKRGSYDKPKHIAHVKQALRVLPIRIGSYGDPCAVPVEVWKKLLAGNSGGKNTGYTRMWDKPENQEYRHFLMASVVNLEEARQAVELGWRYFLVADDYPFTMEGISQVQCLADRKETTCFECRACDGVPESSKPTRTNIWVQVHGVRAKRFSLPVLR